MFRQAMATSMRYMLPKDEILASWNLVEDARDWVGLDPTILGAVMEELGSAHISNLVLFGATDPATFRHTMNETRITTMGGTGERALKALERTQLNLMYNAVRCKLHQELVDVAAPSPTPAQAAVVGMGVGGAMLLNPGAGAIGGYGIINPLMKVPMKSVLDQACDGEVEALSVAELDRLRRNYRSNVGADPPKDQNPTDNQLSCLCRRLEAGGAPYADFCVFRKHGNRVERDLKFKVQVRDVNGGTKLQEIPGPNCFEFWHESWLVFKAACIMLDVATGHTLDRYAAKVRELAVEYPNAWHLLIQTDLIMRSEEWMLEKRKQERSFGIAPQLSTYNAQMPWESVILEASEMETFWTKQYEKPAGRAENRALLGAPAFRQGGPDDRRRDDAAADHRVPKRDREWEQVDDGRKGKSKGKEKKEKSESARPDGRFFCSVNGTQICFDYARNKDGCKATCPGGRAHVCEWCRGSHRSIECPKKPGWVPEPAQKKGDGKKRKF